VNHQVSVAPDGRGEMGVFRLVQAVMSQRVGGVARAHERFEKTDFQRRAGGQAVQALQKLLHLGAPGKIAAFDAVGQHFLAIFLETQFIGRLVDPVERGPAALDQFGGDGLVCQKHEFLDQLMRNIISNLFDQKYAAFFIQTDFGFREIQIQRTGLEAGAADALGQLVRLVKHPLDRA